MKCHPRGVTLDVEIATSLFSHGSAPDGEAELRATAIKSAARYWFRALAGPFVPAPCRRAAAGCGCLRCQEGRVFGSADHGRGVAISLSAQAMKRGNDVSLLPHHPRGRSQLPKSAIVSGQRFQILLSPALPTTSPESIQIVAVSLIVGLALGGIGQRSRRGAGSMALRDIQGAHGVPAASVQQLIQAAEAREMASALSMMIREAKNVVRAAAGSAVGREPASPPAFPMLVHESRDARIVTCPITAGKEGDARAEVMRKLQPFKNAAFGLPYMKTSPGEQQVRGRHASPLWIHLQPGKEGFVGVFTAMRSASLREGNWQRVADFMDSLKGVAVSI